MNSTFPLALVSAHKCHTFVSDKLVLVTIRVDSSLSSGPLRPGCWQPALQHKLVRLRETRPRPFNNWTPHHSKSADLVRVG